MSTNLFQKAIKDFHELGKDISNLDELVLRGTCIDISELIEGWSDLDFSIVVKKLDQENIPQIKNLIQELKSLYDFKISVTVVTSHDYYSLHHYHGMKPIYYSYEVRGDLDLLESKYLAIPHCSQENLLLFDCITNLAYLIHDLRSRYFTCGYTTEEISSFTRHLIKRSKFIVKNAFFARNQQVGSELSRERLMQFFPEIRDEFLNIMNTARYDWKSISQDRDRLIQIMSLFFEQVNYIYESTLISLYIKEQKSVVK